MVDVLFRIEPAQNAVVHGSRVFTVAGDRDAPFGKGHGGVGARIGGRGQDEPFGLSASAFARFGGTVDQESQPVRKYAFVQFRRHQGGQGLQVAAWDLLPQFFQRLLSQLLCRAGSGRVQFSAYGSTSVRLSGRFQVVDLCPQARLAPLGLFDPDLIGEDGNDHQHGRVKDHAQQRTQPASPVSFLRIVQKAHRDTTQRIYGINVVGGVRPFRAGRRPLMIYDRCRAGSKPSIPCRSMASRRAPALRPDPRRSVAV